MKTIKKKSSTGFLTDDGWFTCDKLKVLNTNLFKDLKVGDIIDNIQTKMDNTGRIFVTNFTVVKHSQDSEANINLSSVKSASNPDLIKKDGQMYGLCCKIAFNNLTYQGLVLQFKDSNGNYPNIALGYDLADILYEESLKR